MELDEHNEQLDPKKVAQLTGKQREVHHHLKTRQQPFCILKPFEV
jgi:hypothetical protein